MLRKLSMLFLAFQLTSCAELQQVVNSLPQVESYTPDIASGLREALSFGIDKQVTKLTQTDGFFKNELVKIILPVREPLTMSLIPRRLVKTVSNAPSLDVNELNSGLYLLNIQSKLGQMTKRIIKK